ncbi:MAG: acyltransferase [Ruminococcus sp.]|nr:acyltransferase [Ruminococcus sp.]
MVFNELIFFLGLVPISVLCSFFDRSAEYKNLILVLTSVIFVSWGKPLAVLLIFLTVISEYLLGLAISKTRKNPLGVVLLLADLAINICVLVLLGHNYIFPEGSALSLSTSVIPIGACYYTAKGFSYCFDVYAGNCKAEKNIFCLLTYMVCFHSLMAGPVVRYGDAEPLIRQRTVTGKMLNDGLVRFIIGLGKNVILAPAFTTIKLAGLAHADTTLAGSWLGMLAFLGECWFSFTGLCDMAKGLGLLSGFEYEDNYRDLSVSQLLTGFVRSANTTLIRLFDDVFARFGGSSTFMASLGALVGCGLIALWYHISKPFAAVGIAIGCVLLVERLFLNKLCQKIPAVIKGIYVFILALPLLGGLYFARLADYKHWLLSLVGQGNEYILSISMKNALLGNIFLLIVAFVVVCVPVRKLLTGSIDRLEHRGAQAMAVCRLTKTLLTAAVLFVSVVTLAAQAVR